MISGPKMHSGHQNAPRRKGGQGVYPFFLHRCSEIRRVKNDISVRILKIFQNFALSKVFFTEFHICGKLHTKSHFWRLAPNTVKTKAKWSHSGPKSSKYTFCSKNAFWVQKRILGQKCTFGAKSEPLGEKCDFEQKVPFGALTNSHTGYLFGHLATMMPKNAIQAPNE